MHVRASRHIKKGKLADGKKIATGKLMPHLKEIVVYLQPIATTGKCRLLVVRFLILQEN